MHVNQPAFGIGGNDHEPVMFVAGELANGGAQGRALITPADVVGLFLRPAVVKLCDDSKPAQQASC